MRRQFPAKPLPQQRVSEATRKKIHLARRLKGPPTLVVATLTDATRVHPASRGRDPGYGA